MSFDTICWRSIIWFLRWFFAYYFHYDYDFSAIHLGIFFVVDDFSMYVLFYSVAIVLVLCCRWILFGRAECKFYLREFLRIFHLHSERNEKKKEIETMS